MIRRLARVFVAESLKLVHRKVVYTAFALGMLVSGLSVASSGLQRKIVELGGGKVMWRLNGFELFAGALQNGVLAGAIPVLVLAGLVLAEERELGTAKIVFSKALRRIDVVIAKGLVLLLLATLLVAVTAGFAWTLVGLTNGFYNVVDVTAGGVYRHHLASAMLRYTLIAIALTLPPLWAMVLGGLFLSSCTRQTGVAVGLVFGAAVLVFGAGTFFAKLQPWLVSHWLKYPTDKLALLATGTATTNFLSPKALPEIVRGLTISFATGGALWVLAAGVTMSRQVAGALLVGAAALGIALATPAVARADGIGFRISQHRVEGQVEGMRITDVDGDGRSDLAIFVTQDGRSANPRRFLGLFYQSAEGVFARTPDQVIPVPADAIARVLADLDPARKGYEIGWVTASGIAMIGAKDRVFDVTAPKRIVTEPSLFDLASGRELPSWDDGAQDVDGNGRDDLLLLRKGDAVLYLQDAGGAFKKTAEFPLGYKQWFGPRIESLLLRRFLSFTAELGRPVLADCDGDGKLDVVALREQALEVHLQRADGRFGDAPDRRTVLGSLVAEGEEDSLNQVNADLVDVDGDKAVDLLLFRNVGQVGVFESLRTQVMYCRSKGGWDARDPTQVINLNGISMSPALIDIDGDGDRDLVLSSLRTDLISNLGTALFDSVTITYYVFLYDRGEGRFADTPDFTRDLAMDVKRVEGGGTVPLAYFWGDYDGDGKRDLLTLDEEDQLAIFPARIQPGGLFSSESLDFPTDGRVEVSLRTSNSNKVQDIDWDGRHDLVFWYGEADPSLFTVVMSRGK